MTDGRALDVLRGAARWFEPTPDGFEPVLCEIGDASLVLIGEASHGTREFYDIRAELTKALIVHEGFNLVAAEADWPDAYRANRWVRHASADTTPEAALSDFTRFPRWLWRNDVVVGFLRWLREHNGAREAAARVGFYGLDLYSLHSSIQAVLGYLRKVDPAAAERARHRYGCFEDFAEDTQSYGYAATVGLSRSSKTTWSRRSWSCAGAPRTMRRATDGSPPTIISSPNRTRAWSGTRRSTTARCSAGARSRGTCATAT
jgi:erythromycin esterase-like protein